MPQDFRLGDWIVQPSADRLARDGQTVRLRTKVMDLLVFLASHPGEVLSKDHILQGVWKTEFVSESALTSAITELRQALGDDVDRPRIIETIPKRGYRLVAAVEQLPTTAAGQSPTRTARTVRALIGVAVTSAVVGAALTAGVLRWAVAPPRHSSAVVRASIDVRPASGLATIATFAPEFPKRTAFAISPDGRTLVFTGREKDGPPVLFVRRLHEDSARRLNEERRAEGVVFSPDGRAILYWTPINEWTQGARKGEIRRISLDGGASELIAIAPRPAGLAWSDDGWIYWGHLEGPISRAPESGGRVETVTQLGVGEVSHRLPHVLPNHRALLYTVLRAGRGLREAQIVAKELPDGSPKPVAEGADPRFVTSGHLIFARMGKLLAAPFDVRTLTVRGDPVVVSPVMQAGNSFADNDDSGAAQASVSNTGTLAFLPGSVFPDLRAEVLWVDRRGRPEPVGVPIRPWSSAQLSPDGRFVALGELSAACRCIWFYDLERRVLIPAQVQPAGSILWSPDGAQHLITGALRWYLGSGTPGGPLKEVTLEPRSTFGRSPVSWTADGRTILGVEGSTVVAVSLNGVRGTVKTLLSDTQGQDYPEISPDGRWLAHIRADGGVLRLVVRPYPEADRTWQVSSERGYAPCWRRDGRELFFRSPREGAPHQMMSVTFDGRGSQPQFGTPQTLFSLDGYLSTYPKRSHDIDLEGKRFLMVKTLPREVSPPPSQISLVFNWFEELKQKAPLR